MRSSISFQGSDRLSLRKVPSSVLRAMLACLLAVATTVGIAGAAAAESKPPQGVIMMTAP